MWSDTRTFIFCKSLLATTRHRSNEQCAKVALQAFGTADQVDNAPKWFAQGCAL